MFNIALLCLPGVSEGALNSFEVGNMYVQAQNFRHLRHKMDLESFELPCFPEEGGREKYQQNIVLYCIKKIITKLSRLGV